MLIETGYHWVMRRVLFLTLFGILAIPSFAQSADSKAPAAASVTDPVLSFDAGPAGSAPEGWLADPAGTVLVDDKVVHTGPLSVRIERKADSPGSSSSLTKVLPIGFSGSTVELRGFVRTEDVSGYATLWMREEKDGETVVFVDLQTRRLTGTNDWSEVSVNLPLEPGGQQLLVGALISGTGKAWVEGLQLLVDGKPASQAPKADNPLTAMNRDHQFDGGSGIVLSSLTPTQIDNLALLGRVWGYLKYHHPQVTTGQFQWDYELFRVMPAVIAAPDRAAAQGVLLKWIGGLGAVQPCDPCATLDASELQLGPDLAWTADETLLGKDLAKALQFIQRNRPAGKQFYVSLVPVTKNPSFDHERTYFTIRFPDAGFQILALYRFWNIVEYWSPNRNIVGEDWDGVLREFLPRMALAKTSDEYQLQLMALIAQDHDTHANLWSSLRVRPPVGECRLPVNLRFVGQSPVIYSLASTDATAAAGFKMGDVITELDGQPVDKLVQAWSPYYADSNQAARLRDIAQNMTNGACGPATVSLLRGSETVTVKSNRIPAAGMTGIRYTHDLPGNTFRLLSDRVAYLKLSSVKVADIDRYLQLAAKTQGLIVDIRNYPSEFVPYALGSHLIEQPMPFVKFTVGDLTNPGAFHWDAPVRITPASPQYAGKVIILVDEISQSQAEFTAMALRASPHAMVIGSTTAGADGNYTNILLPGGLNTGISGLGVFYPDGRPTQQIGIVPDKTVVPTIDGIRAGRDEVLEEAVRQILGPGAPEDAIRKIGAP
ncbi:MAG: S41 family peptidase [Terracidiphilus sp.]|jgi:C-terminal processing protease CtpA/Prc